MSRTDNEARAQQIIKEATEFRKNCHRKVTYQDYERYKQQLIAEGLFGHEAELADALRI